jgi:TatD DNase family protein
MIDTHCHLTYAPLSDQLDEVLAKAKEMGVDRMITVGTSPDDAVKAAFLAIDHPGIYATAGLHPSYSGDWLDEDKVKTQLRILLTHERVVAVGEMGLDCHYADPPLDLQQGAFEWQLDLMKETGLPGVIHNRQATDRTLSTLRGSGLPAERFVFHCFTGSLQELHAILDFGAMVSFTGIVTFKNSSELATAQLSVPMDRLMIETDSPYLTPEPFRKERTNQPCYVSQVAKFLAMKRNLLLEDFIAQVDANAQRFFNLPAYETSGA